MEPVTSLAEWFCTSKRLEGRSERTLTIARQSIRAFGAYLGDKDVEQVTQGDVVAFLSSYRETHAPSTTAVMRSYLASFWHWAMAEGLAEVDVFRGVPAPSVPDTDPHVAEDDEFEAMIRVTAGPSFMDRRDVAILRLLESSGLRRAELGGALVENLDLENQILDILGKGGKRRRVAFDDETSNALRHYIRLRSRQEGASSPRLFIGARGPLSGDAVGAVVVKAARRAGVKSTAHSFRHRFAHKMKAAGMSDESLQSLGGWVSPVCLRRYGKAQRVNRALAEYRGIRRRA